MKNKKIVQIILRTSQEEKETITKNALKQGKSVNEYIKTKVLETNKNNDINSDSISDIIVNQQRQLEEKDIQISTLHKLLENQQTLLLNEQKESSKLLTTESNNKKWWKFW
ncbi:DUF536 domain-containing protein [Streptococcus marimammalium]|uniref:DUF536 domain-containing protein n=1 Tax=Streptococcus marimammalium TaxID=269666 RepID=UPI00037668D8|nr:DUF536 domain-containing protein [Streptococcus marimammalium]